MFCIHLKNLIHYANSNSKIRKIPSSIIINFLRILELLGLSPLQKEQYMIANKDFFLDTEKAKKILNWESKINFASLVEEMVESDLKFVTDY